MPIEKHEDGGCTIRFGTGDVCITGIGNYAGLAFRTDTPHQIGEMVFDRVGQTIDDWSEYPVLLRFENRESLEALITSLRQTQKDHFPDAE